jgi:hypothetical protein
MPAATASAARSMARTTWPAVLAAVWLACLPIGRAHGAAGDRGFRARADGICASAARELKPLDRRLVEIFDPLKAGEPSARADYATLLESTIAIHRRADRRLSRIHPARARAKRFRAMIAADRLLFGPRAERVATLYRQPSSAENAAEIERLEKLAKERARHFQRLVAHLGLSDCRNLD